MQDGLQDFLDDYEERLPQDEADDEAPEDTTEFDDVEETEGQTQDDDEVDVEQDDGSDTDADEDASPETSAKPDSGADIKALQDQLKTLEKRFKDTQANWTREHQKALELEKKLNALKKGDVADEWMDDDDANVEAVTDSQEAERLARIEQMVQQLQQQQVAAKFEASENEARKKHDDYDDVIENVLVPEMQENPAIKDEWQAKGGTPEAAYELGVKLRQAKAIMTDPEGYRQQLEKEIIERLQNGEDGGNKQRRPKPLLGVNNQAGKKKHTSMQPASLLDEALADL